MPSQSELYQSIYKYLRSAMEEDKDIKYKLLISLLQNYQPLSPSVSSLLEEWQHFQKAKQESKVDSPEWKTVEKAYIEHLEWRFAYPKITFERQMRSFWLITTLLFILIISGLVFAFFQLYRAFQLGDVSSLQTQIAIETAGKLSIGSSIVGAIVLIISLVFFYLYLRYVFEVKYPIPPHVSLLDTDVFKIIEKLSSSDEDRTRKEGPQATSSERK